MIASKSLPEMYLRTRVVDLNNDGSAEIIALKSGRWDTNGVPIPHQLAVYAYTDNLQLTLLDEVVISTEYDDNMTYLWVQDRRIIVPIPEKFEEHMLKMRILRYQGYRLIDKQLIEEPESLTFEWKYYNDAPLTLSLQNQTLDLNGDGSLGHLQIVERKYLRFVKYFPSSLPR